MVDNVFREPTDKEEKEMVMLDVTGGKHNESVLDKFKKKVTEKEQECTKKSIPFCRRCALLDFKKLIDNTMRDAEEVVYETDINKFRIKMPDLNQYIGEDRFNHKKDQDAMEKVARTVAGQTVYSQVKVGVHRDFECKIRKCGVSIFLSNEQLEKIEKKVK